MSTEETREAELDDLPECSCAMTEGSMRTCPRHGDVPWVEHVLSEYGTTTCPVEVVRAEVDDGRCSACGGLVTPPAPTPEAPDNRLPYEPPGLRDLIDSLTYKPGWQFFMQVFREDGDEAPRGWRFHVVSRTEDSLNPERRIIHVNHAFPIPPASYNRDTWAAWLFDRVRDVETHEAGEFFRLDGYREFAPHHGNGEDPYRVWHVGDHETARKSAGDD